MRAALVKDELKYRDLVATGFDLVLRRFPAFVTEDLCKLLSREASSATIFLANSEPYALEVFQSKHQDGAEFAVDFGIQDVIRETSERMIKEIPLYRLSPYDLGEVIVVDKFNPARTIRFDIRETFETDTPNILQELGGKLRDAEVFAARAYSVLDLGDRADRYRAGSALARSSFGRVVLKQALKVPRIFDRDHAASVRVLNKRVNALHRIGGPLDRDFGELVREEDSRAVDALQAADIAAGFAREILDRKGLRALVDQFRKVVLNGASLSESRDLG